VCQHAEEHGRRDDGHGVVRSRTELFEREEREDQGGEASRAEPADEQHRLAIEACTDRGKGDGNHPHQGEAEHGIQHGGRVHAVEHDGYGDRAEREPYEKRHQAAGLLEEGELRGTTLAGCCAEGQPSAERGDKPVAVHDVCGRVGEEGQGEDCDTREVLGSPTPAARPPQQPSAAEPHGHTHGRADRQLSYRLPWPHCLLEGLRGGGSSDREHDDGGGDAVVEAAFHVDQPTHAGRHHRVGDDRDAQRGIGGR
jgi:hypothetical protein